MNCEIRTSGLQDTITSPFFLPKLYPSPVFLPLSLAGMKKRYIIGMLLPLLVAAFSFNTPAFTASVPHDGAARIEKKSITPGELEWRDARGGSSHNPHSQHFSFLSNSTFRELRPFVQPAEKPLVAFDCYAANDYLNHIYPTHHHW